MSGAWDIMTGVQTWLWQSSVQGAILVAVILAVQWLFRNRITPQWRYALWGVLVVRLALVWAPSAPFSVYNLAPQPAPVAPVVAEVAEVIPEPASTETPTELPAPMLGDGGAALAERFRDGSDGRDNRDGRDISNAPAVGTSPGLASDVISRSDRESLKHDSDSVAASSSGSSWRWRDVAGLSWLVVLVSLLSLMSLQSLRFARRVHAGRLVTNSETLDLLEDCRRQLKVDTFVALVETDSVTSPALLGCIRPKIVVPPGYLEGLSRDDARYIFLHELAHVKRGDIWTSWLFNLLLAVHWFNPVIWYARRRFIVDRETACDAHVLAALDEPAQREYGHTIINLTQRFSSAQWAPGIAGISESNSNLKRRITMIKDYRAPTRLAAWSGVGLCLLIALATLTNAQEQPETPGDIHCIPTDIYGYTATNGGTMIAVQLTNNSTAEQVVDVEFWEGEPDKGTKIGRGGLAIAPGMTGTEAIPWPVSNGQYDIHVRIDPDNTIAEVDETNNVVRVEIQYTNGRFRLNPIRDGRNGRRVGPTSSDILDGDDEEFVDWLRSSLREQVAAATNASNLRAHCQNNMKQLGLVFKMYANESKGELWPVLSREPGQLMFAWGGPEEKIGDMPVLSYEFLSDLTTVACPAQGEAPPLPDDRDFVYLGYAVKSDEDVARFAAAYHEWKREGMKHGTWFWQDIEPEDNGQGTILRLREGVERFFITDINNPAAGALAQSQIPVLIEWPNRHGSADETLGGNVLYMDGHVEFVPYPGKWPMTENTIGLLGDMAGRESDFHAPGAHGSAFLPSLAPQSLDADDPRNFMEEMIVEIGRAVDGKYRGDCQQHMKQAGLAFKMYALESEGALWPPLSREPRQLLFNWGDTKGEHEGRPALSRLFVSDPSIFGCPAVPSGLPVLDDRDYFYLGHVIRNDADVRLFVEKYTTWLNAGGGKDFWISDDKPRSPDQGLVRLREGVERFLITDINNPAAGGIAQSRIPVLIEWPEHHQDYHGSWGGNVLYMDGHVEFKKYPGEWPMTEETIGMLSELARREEAAGSLPASLINSIEERRTQLMTPPKPMGLPTAPTPVQQPVALSPDRVPVEPARPVTVPQAPPEAIRPPQAPPTLRVAPAAPPSPDQEASESPVPTGVSSQIEKMENRLSRLVALQARCAEDPSERIYEFDIETQVKSDARVAACEKELATTETALAKYRVDKKKGHPNVARMEAEVEALEERLAEVRVLARKDALEGLVERMKAELEAEVRRAAAEERLPVSGGSLACRENLEELSREIFDYGEVTGRYRDGREIKDEVYPVLSQKKGALAPGWSVRDTGAQGFELQQILAAHFTCPDSGYHFVKGEGPDDGDYVYLGYVLQGDEDVRQFAHGYEASFHERVIERDDWPFQEDLVVGENTLFRLREDVQPLLMPEVDNPEVVAGLRASIPMVVEWPDRHVGQDGTMGGHVLYLDGHVEFLTYPGKWPMTQETIGILAQMAERPPVPMMTKVADVQASDG